MTPGACYFDYIGCDNKCRRAKVVQYSNKNFINTPVAPGGWLNNGGWQPMPKPCASCSREPANKATCGKFFGQAKLCTNGTPPSQVQGGAGNVQGNTQANQPANGVVVDCALTSSKPDHEREFGCMGGTPCMKDTTTTTTHWNGKVGSDGVFRDHSVPFIHVPRSQLVQEGPTLSLGQGSVANNGIRVQHGVNHNEGATGWTVNNLPTGFGAQTFAYTHTNQNGQQISEGLCDMNLPPIEAGDRRLAEQSAVSGTSAPNPNGSSSASCSSSWQHPWSHYGCCI